MNKVPPGTYVATISSFVQKGNRLKVGFKIAEGEFKGVSVPSICYSRKKKVK